MIKKIVIIGPESTGKTTLCQQLAAHYKTLWCTEFARAYLLANGKEYNYDDLLKIAKGQAASEDYFLTQATQHSIFNTQNTTSTPYFFDTDMYVMKVWCEYVFDQCHQFILNEIVNRKYDLYLFCNIDLPWVSDELREYPNEKPRQELYNMYKDILINQQTPWIEISGNYDERLSTAVKAIDGIIGT